MKKSVLLCWGLLAAFAAPAQEVGRVLASTPVIQQVAVPRQVCGNQVQNMPQCETQTFYENRAVAYNITYEYAGRQYTVQMLQDPGAAIPLQVTPVGVVTTQPGYAQSYAGGLGATTITSSTTIYPPPYPGYYVRPYYPSVFLNFGYSSHRHRHRHHHWR